MPTETPKVQTARKKKTCHGNLQVPSDEMKIWHAYYGIPFNPPAWSLDGGGDSRERLGRRPHGISHQSIMDQSINQSCDTCLHHEKEKSELQLKT
jgi:hypothetical protein